MLTARNRRAVTLVELLVVVCILAVLLGLLLPAVQNVRLSAARTINANVARQVLLATHHFSDVHAGRMPKVGGIPPDYGMGVLSELAMLLECPDDRSPPRGIRFASDPSRGASGLTPEAPPPLTPPLPGPSVPPPQRDNNCSLAFNPSVYAAGAKLSSVAPDGLSMTIALTEHYGVCHQSTFRWIGAQNNCEDGSGKSVPCVYPPIRRATFADRPQYNDVGPVTGTSAGVPVTVGSLPLTFQVRPPLTECDPRIPQSSTPGGILTGLLDGSVRTVRQGVSPQVFWGSVTPDRGESVTLD